MCTCMPMSFQRNLVTFAKARPAQMIFISTSFTLAVKKVIHRTAVVRGVSVVVSHKQLVVELCLPTISALMGVLVYTVLITVAFSMYTHQRRRKMF